MDAEQAVISCVIVNNDLWPEVAESLNKNDFCSKNYQILFEMMRFLSSKNDPIDKITLVNLLKKSYNLNDTNNTDFIKALIKNAPNSANIKTYIKNFLSQLLKV